MKRFVKIIGVLVAMIAITACSSTGVTDPDGPGNDQLTVAIDADQLSQTVGDTLFLDVTIENAEGFQAMSFDVAYDTAVLTLAAVHHDGGFLGVDGITMIMPTDTGAVVGVGRAGNADATSTATGGLLAELALVCEAAGSCAVVIDGFTSVDENGEPLAGVEELVAQSITVEVLPNGS